MFFADYMRQSGAPNYPPRSGYDELDTTLMPPRPGEQYAGGGGGGQQPPPPQQGGPGGQLVNNTYIYSPFMFHFGSFYACIFFFLPSFCSDPSSGSLQNYPMHPNYEDPQQGHLQAYPAPRASFDEEEPAPLPMMSSSSSVGQRASQPRFHSDQRGSFSPFYFFFAFL